MNSREAQARIAPLAIAALLVLSSASGCSAATAEVERRPPAKAKREKIATAQRDDAAIGSSATRVLHTGDSTVGGGLSHALRRIFAFEGATYTRDSTRSMAIKTFARTHHFEEMLAAVDPDLVILTLGTNDVFDPHPEALAASVDAIVAKATAPSATRPDDGPRRCWWIGPPTWRGNTGIVDVIRAHAAPCLFFDSSNMKNVARTRDGIHPSERGGATWAIAFWERYEARPPSDDERRVIFGTNR